MLKIKMQPMFKYSISLCIMLMSCFALAQDDDSVSRDSLKFKEKYGLRLGADAGKLARTFLDKDYTGFEINGDYRLTYRLYIAGELGTEERTTSTDFLNSTAKGSYFKAGIDYNMYRNWLGMENMIYAGFRVSASTFSQTINSYTIFNTNQTFPQPTITEAREIDGLTALWGELIIGVKAETLNNLYVGLNIQFKGLISETEPDNFENVYIPGFGRTFDSGSFGIGFGYNISYLIPIFKKEKTVVVESAEDDR